MWSRNLTVDVARRYPPPMAASISVRENRLLPMAIGQGLALPASPRHARRARSYGMNMLVNRTTADVAAENEEASSQTYDRIEQRPSR